MIPYGRQSISEEDIQAVVDVLRSDFLTQGPAVPAFERGVAEYCGAEYAVAVNSATSALHIACLALDVGPGDYVWTTPITFVASANCVCYCGAKVDFVDIDPETGNMSVERLTQKLARAQTTNTLPKVLIPVHLAGEPCDMIAIHALSQQYGFKIIEDASHAVGGRYRDQAIGNCRYSDIAVFSFHPVKIITSGEGGMALTNVPELGKKMFRLRSHGVTRDAAEMTRQPDGPWYYQQLELGYNYRMTDIQAALGLSQLQRLDEFVSQRHNIAKRYDALLSHDHVLRPHRDKENYSALHLYIIRIEHEKISADKQHVFEFLRSQGVGVNVHYIPVHTHPYFQRMGYKSEDFPEANRFYAEAISLPLYPDLTDAQQDQVVNALREAMNS